MISTYQRLRQQRDAGEISGFTLIELLIVIVVLGILAAVVIFALGGITGKSQLAACQADGATVSTALAAFHAQNPNVTTANINGVAGQKALYETTGGGIGTGGPYIQSWPKATSYQYSLVAGVLKVQKLDATGAPTGSLVTYAGPSSCGPAVASTTSIGL